MVSLMFGSSPITLLIGENTGEARRAASAAAASAAAAEAVVGPNYASTSAGLAATTNGQSFAVDNGDGTVSIYRKVSGSAVLQRTIGTTAYNDGRFALKSVVNDFINGIAETVVATLENPSTADAASLRRALSIAGVEAMKSAALNINGNHRVSQEVGAVEQTGIGSASPGTQKWMTDGHKLWVQGTARVKAQQVTVSDLPGFNRALRVEVTTAQPTIGSDFIRHLTFCETERFLPCAWGTAKARDLVRYAWVKTSMAGTYDVVILNGNRAVASEVGTFTVDAPNTWQLVKTVIPAVTFASDWTASGMGYRCEIALAGGGSPNLAAEVGHYFQTTGEVFLPADYDLGLSDTALLMPTLQENFAACQRFYQKSYNMSTVPGTAATFGGSIQRITDVAASFHTLGHIHFGVPMAGIPSITLYSPNSGATGKCYDANGTADVNATVVDAGAQGFNAFINSVSVAATRTLSFQFVADARIG